MGEKVVASSCRTLFLSGIFLFVLISFPLINSVEASSELWGQKYGGGAIDSAEDIVQTSDGGYAIAGFTGSFGAELFDFWLIKTDASGNMIWNQRYGEEGIDAANSLVETSDGGYALAGRTKSFGAGEYDDLWLVKTDEYGIPEFPDTTPPTISIASPENKTYTVNNVSLTFTVNELTSWIGYSLDEQANVTITGNTTLTGLAEKPHTRIVYAKDIAGNTGASETIYFTTIPLPPKNGPSGLPRWAAWAVAVSVMIVAVVGVALLVYFGKIKKTTGETNEHSR